MDLTSHGGMPIRPASFSESGSIVSTMRAKFTKDAAPIALSADVGSLPFAAWCATTTAMRRSAASFANLPMNMAAAELLLPSTPPIKDISGSKMTMSGLMRSSSALSASHPGLWGTGRYRRCLKEEDPTHRTNDVKSGQVSVLQSMVLHGGAYPACHLYCRVFCT